MFAELGSCSVWALFMSSLPSTLSLLPIAFSLSIGCSSFCPSTMSMCAQHSQPTAEPSLFCKQCSIFFTPHPTLWAMESWQMRTNFNMGKGGDKCKGTVEAGLEPKVQSSQTYNWLDREYVVLLLPAPGWGGSGADSLALSSVGFLLISVCVAWGSVWLASCGFTASKSLAHYAHSLSEATPCSWNFGMKFSCLGWWNRCCFHQGSLVSRRMQFCLEQVNWRCSWGVGKISVRSFPECPGHDGWQEHTVFIVLSTCRCCLNF